MHLATHIHRYIIYTVILVTVDVVRKYPSILYDSSLKALHEKLEEKEVKKIPSTDLVNMSVFVLKAINSSYTPKLKEKSLVQM